MEYDKDADVAQLYVHSIELADAGIYECRAINELGHTATKAQLIVESADGKQTPKKKEPTKPAVKPPEPKKEPPKFLTNLQDTAAQIGDDITLSVTSKLFLEPDDFRIERELVLVLASETPIPRVTWYKNGEPVDLNDVRYEVKEEGNRFQLRIGSASASDECQYRCVAVTPGGSAESKCQLTVSVPANFKKPEFTKPLSDVTTGESSALKLEVKLEANPLPEISW